MEKPIINKNALYIALTLIGLFLVYIIFFQGCGKNVHKDDKRQVDSITRVANERHRVDSIRVVAYKNATDTLSKYTAIQKQKIEVLEKQLDITGTRANKLAYAVANAKIVHDTVGYISGCDSLGDAVIDLTHQVDNYQEEQKRLVNGYEFQLTYKDSIINIQTTGRADLLRDFNNVSGKYGMLYTDYGKLVKKNRRSVLLNKILAGLVLGLGTAVYLNK